MGTVEWCIVGATDTVQGGIYGHGALWDLWTLHCGHYEHNALWELSTESLRLEGGQLARKAGRSLFIAVEFFPAP